MEMIASMAETKGPEAGAGVETGAGAWAAPLQAGAGVPAGPESMSQRKETTTTREIKSNHEAEAGAEA